MLITKANESDECAMSDFKQLSEETKQFLRDLLDEVLDKYDIISDGDNADDCREFLKQYTVFVYDEECVGFRKKKNQGWFVTQPFTDFFTRSRDGKTSSNWGSGLLGRVDVKESETTDVSCRAWKGEFSGFDVGFCDFRGISTANFVFACDLFKDFKPKHFSGNIWICNEGNFCKREENEIEKFAGEHPANFVKRLQKK